MKTKIGLNANQSYVMKLASRANASIGLLQFGWIYINGESGGAKVQITDNNGEQQPSAEVPTPGVFASVVRESSPPNISIIQIDAGAEGFRGELHFDLLDRR